MSWTVEWSDVCESDVRRIPWRLATDICGAVLKFASTGEGSIEAASMGEDYFIRVRVPGAVALGRLAPSKRKLQVWRVYAAR
jgi:hypothetical protein